MKPLKITILGGLIFPFQSPRSYRSTDLAIEFARLGHEVTLYGLIGNYDYSDFEKETGVKIKKLGKSLLGNINSDGDYFSNSFFYKAFIRVLSKLLRNLIAYPSIEYFFKAKKALAKEDKFDLLITVAQPYGLHWGAAYYKKYKDNQKFKLWISDSGDPFMGNPIANRRKIFLKRIEKFWCQQTDYITVPVSAAKQGYYEEFRDKIRVIPQGVNFSKVVLSDYSPNEIPTFIFGGVLYPRIRNPHKFLEYLCSLDYEFKFIVYANNTYIFKQFKEKLGHKFELKPYVPRFEFIQIVSTMDFAINFRNDSSVQVPSKLIDYSLSKRPIIEISPDFPEEEKIAFEQFLEGNYQKQYIIDNIQKYDIEKVVKAFLDLYDDDLAI